MPSTINSSQTNTKPESEKPKTNPKPESEKPKTNPKPKSEKPKTNPKPELKKQDTNTKSNKNDDDGQKILKLEKNHLGFKCMGFKYQETDNTSYYKMLEKTNRPIERLTDFVPTKSKLFISQKTKTSLNNVFQGNNTQPIMIQGLVQSGKCSAIMSSLSQLKIYCPTIKEGDKLTDIRFFQNYPDERFNKILFFHNCYYINLKLLLTVEQTLIIDFIMEKCGNYRGLDRGCKIFIICNIHILSPINQKKLTNLIEKYYCNYLFIMTTSKPVKINAKLRNVSLSVLFPKLEPDVFTSVFRSNFEHLLKKQELQSIDKFYLIYETNNYNLQHTLYHIAHLKSQGKLTLKTFDKKKNYISLQKMIISNIINKFCTQSNISNIDELRKVLLILISLNLDLDSVILDTINLLITTSISDDKKGRIIKLGSEFSIHLAKADKPIIHFEKFFIDLIIIINI